jgi:hypothetical protein
VGVGLWNMLSICISVEGKINETISKEIGKKYKAMDAKI